MLSPVSAVESANASAENATTARRQEVPTLADKMREAALSLERTKRDLAAAQLRAERQERLIADARRELEQLRWLNASSEANSETERLAASALAAQNAAIDAAMKAGADTGAQIVRLQNRIERQTTRYFDLQNRARENEAPEKAKTGAGAEPERENGAIDPSMPTMERRQAPVDAPREAVRREEKWDIRDFAALARRAWSRRTTKSGTTAPA